MAWSRHSESLLPLFVTLLEPPCDLPSLHAEPNPHENTYVAAEQRALSARRMREIREQYGSDVDFWLPSREPVVSVALEEGNALRTPRGDDGRPTSHEAADTAHTPVADQRDQKVSGSALGKRNACDDGTLAESVSNGEVQPKKLKVADDGLHIHTQDWDVVHWIQVQGGFVLASELLVRLRGMNLVTINGGIQGYIPRLRKYAVKVFEYIVLRPAFRSPFHDLVLLFVSPTPRQLGVVSSPNNVTMPRVESPPMTEDKKRWIMNESWKKVYFFNNVSLSPKELQEQTSYWLTHWDLWETVFATPLLKQREKIRLLREKQQRLG
ncbi:hypothetical protein OF83DRAFT_1130567 [Amylostereum chailletii]|nr:hypothetical protein OF83DRAFT_1130567 [Amylostereum chailletii]